MLIAPDQRSSYWGEAMRNGEVRLMQGNSNEREMEATFPSGAALWLLTFKGQVGGIPDSRDTSELGQETVLP